MVRCVLIKKMEIKKRKDGLMSDLVWTGVKWDSS